MALSRSVSDAPGLLARYLSGIPRKRAGHAGGFLQLVLHARFSLVRWFTAPAHSAASGFDTPRSCVSDILVWCRMRPGPERLSLEEARARGSTDRETDKTTTWRGLGEAMIRSNTFAPVFETVRPPCAPSFPAETILLRLLLARPGRWPTATLIRRALLAGSRPPWRLAAYRDPGPSDGGLSRKLWSRRRIRYLVARSTPGADAAPAVRCSMGPKLAAGPSTSDGCFFDFAPLQRIVEGVKPQRSRQPR